MKNKISDVSLQINSFEINNILQLEAFRIQFLGSKSEIKNLFGELKTVPNEDKKLIGKELNDLRIQAEEKYAEHNWRKGFVWSRPLSAAMRHITAFNAGEDKDPESGLSHLAHAACCIMFLLEFEKTHKELDDRYKP